MKFGKQLKRLADPAQRNHCIQYDILKKAINVVVAQQSQEAARDINADLRAVKEAFHHAHEAFERGSYRALDSRFYELLKHELAKVNRFAGLQLRTLVEALQEAHRLLASAGQPANADILSLVEQKLDWVSDELAKMEQFRRLNFTGFRKIAKKFDKASIETSPLSSWFVPQLLREFFVAAPLDPLILAIGWGYSGLRRHRSAAVDTLTMPDMNLSNDEGSTRTFWLTPNARLRALCTLLKRFELVLPPTASAAGDAELTPDRQQRLVMSMTTERLALMPRLSADTSLVYYDTPSFGMYTQRMEHEASGLAGFRCRRTQASGSQGATGMLVERDGAASALGLHAFTPVPVLQAPDAFPLADDAVGKDAATLRAAAKSALLRPESSQPGWSNFPEYVSQLAMDDGLCAMATVGCQRVLLKGDTPATQGVSIALDEDVQFSRGPAGLALTAPTSAIDFPYCLLEIASPGLEGIGSWLDEVRGLAALRNIEGFTTGAHAIAALHTEAVPALPHWFEHLSVVENSAPVEAWGLTLEWRAACNESIAHSKKHSDAGRERGLSHVDLTTPGSAIVSFGSASAEAECSDPKKWDQPPGLLPPLGESVVAQRLHPKDFLATERTMLEWIHTVLALAFLGVTLWQVSLRGSRGIINTADVASFSLGCYSLVLVLIAVVFAWTSVFTHIKRTEALLAEKTTEGVFNSRDKPTIFAIAVGAALLGHLVVQVTPMFVGNAGDVGSANVTSAFGN